MKQLPAKNALMTLMQENQNRKNILLVGESLIFNANTATMTVNIDFKLIPTVIVLHPSSLSLSSFIVDVPKRANKVPSRRCRAPMTLIDNAGRSAYSCPPPAAHCRSTH